MILSDKPVSPVKVKVSAAVFCVLLLLSLIPLFNGPWIFPSDMKDVSYFTFELMRYNFERLLHLEGGYVITIWAWLVFISASTLFCTAGSPILSKILSWRNGGKDSPNEQISKLEHYSVSWMLGSWVLSMVWFFLGITGFYQKTVALSLTVLGLLLFVLFLLKNVRRMPALQLNGIDGITAGNIILAVWLLSWTAVCFFPNYYWDTLMINMANPGYYAAEGRLAANPFHIYTYYAQNSEMLNVWMILSGAKEAASLLIWGYLVALILFMYGWISRSGSRIAAFGAVAVFASSSFALWLASYVKNDLQLGIFLILQWWALSMAFSKFTSKDDNVGSWILLSGLFAGIAFGFKFTAVPSIAVTVAASSMFFFLYSDGNILKKVSDTLRIQMVFLLGILIAAGPWLVRSFIISSGNPVYPFLNDIFGAKLLYPWHTHIYTAYNLKELGFNGLLEYFGNLTRLMPSGTFSGVHIWWGASATICLFSFLCLSNMFSRETKWISRIAVACWMFSLYFALKPPYHAGPLIFVLTCCFGFSLYLIFKNHGKKWMYAVFFIVISLHFAKSAAFVLSKEVVPKMMLILLAGSPVENSISTIPAGLTCSSVDEMNWTYYLINQYTDPGEKVLLVGTVRPFGIERRHLFSFSLNQQPVLYFAAQSRDAEDLKNRLLATGIKHIVYDPMEWKEWVQGITVDGPHQIKVNQADVDKVNDLIKNSCDLRFGVPSGKLLWYGIRRDGSAEYKEEMPFEAKDADRFPNQYLDIAYSFVSKGEADKALPVLEALNSHVYTPDINNTASNLLGACYVKNKEYDKAIAQFTKCIEMDPSYVAAIKNRANVYKAMGKDDLAKQDYEKVTALEPNNKQYETEYKNLK